MREYNNAMINNTCIVSAIVIFSVAFLVNQIIVVHKAPSDFDNYYKFRRRIRLINKTDKSADCILKTGKTIKVVVYKNMWYLDGDLPTCRFDICL